ncbi:hypothetical protein GCM10007860_25290 [Chitiniphilus shinanonensis]|uniref:Uncharacterized protein n=1 Tax=Chitiniphilus shinanonensis TaxID=553088 RepID=A0ABQ6BYR6_9NEIS|nr:hypothetical protein [Chitiniphilus shinanonensis]GLS05377.1 hypothetical protein GCM10007860_25290 [Chitiniphilus shinanonensis]
MNTLWIKRLIRCLPLCAGLALVPTAQAEVNVDIRFGYPPPPPYAVVVPPPRYGYYWRPGRWVYYGPHRRWDEGYWMRHSWYRPPPPPPYRGGPRWEHERWDRGPYDKGRWDDDRWKHRGGDDKRYGRDGGYDHSPRGHGRGRD